MRFVVCFSGIEVSKLITSLRVGGMALALTPSSTLIVLTLSTSTNSTQRTTLKISTMPSTWLMISWALLAFSTLKVCLRFPKFCGLILFYWLFIHSGYLYSTPSRNLSPTTAKEKCLKKLEERKHIVPGQQAQRRRKFIPSGGSNYVCWC